MPKYSLTRKDKSFLTIEIDGKTYNIPLATTLKLKEVRKFLKIGKKTEEEQLDFLIDFFGHYLGEEIIDEMTIPDVQELFLGVPSILLSRILTQTVLWLGTLVRVQGGKTP